VTSLDAAEPVDLARAWLAVDPDGATRAETEDLIAAGSAVLASRFGESLRFGTAGLRGRLGAGPNRMNRVLVRLVAAAIAEQVGDEVDPHVAIGYDARHGSADFASDTARVLLARGVRCTILPRPLPTPVLAFTVQHLKASAGVMVTASHNPREDNGYKVYGRGGALLTSPLDTQIATAMRRMPLLSDLDLVPMSDSRLTPGPEHLVDDYLDAVVASLGPSTSRSVVTVHTALHGVGTETATRAFAMAGFRPLHTVSAQAEPDPDFPTAPFPNPEEPGTLDLLLSLGDAVGADLAIANDPDADRLSVAVPTDRGWHNLTGDDVGCLLADHLLRRPEEDERAPLVITTITSSRLLARIASSHHADYSETLTGFKWIMHERAAHPNHRFVSGYEEALGYAAGELVPDKDGISAALTIAELASELKDDHKTLLNRLDELHVAHGVHVTGQRAIRFETQSADRSAPTLAMAHLRAVPPGIIAGKSVLAIHDLDKSETGLPPTDGLVFDFADARLVIRPSGTEPKMKIYGEIIAPADGDVAGTRTVARRQLRQLLAEATALACAFDLTAATAADAVSSPVAAVFSHPPSAQQRLKDLALLVHCIDLTTLEGDDTAARVRALCAQARRPDVTDPTIGPVAAVCVYPAFVERVADMLRGTNIAVASVAGAFPSALSTLPTRIADIEDAVRSGADEVDIVLNRSAMIEGRLDQVAAELAAARQAAGDTHLKVILEVGELGPGRIASAARLAIDAGADFIKTSTGKAKVSATPEAVWEMADVIKTFFDETGRRVGLKIAGGVRSADDALGYVNIVRTVLGDEWLTPDLLRFGASSLLDAVIDDLDTTRHPPGAPHTRRSSLPT
jgi:phosphomannomutase